MSALKQSVNSFTRSDAPGWNLVAATRLGLAAERRQDSSAGRKPWVLGTSGRQPRSGGRRNRDLCTDLQAVGFKRNEFARMVRKDVHRADIQSREDLRADAVFALFASKTDGLVGIRAVLPVILEERATGP